MMSTTAAAWEVGAGATGVRNTGAGDTVGGGATEGVGGSTALAGSVDA
jgi:hypothetical protein